MFKVSELLKATQGKLISGDANSSVRGISIDSRSVRKDEAFIAIKGEKFDGHDFIDAVLKKGVRCIICRKARKRKGVTFIRVKDTVRALGEIAAFNRKRFKNIPVIAVTGSCGKTTAKDMIAGVLAKKFRVLKNQGTRNNHIGLPLTLLKLDASYDLAVLEIGTNHFGEVKYLARIAQPNIGVITNIGPSHLEYFGCLKGVFREKYELIRHLHKPALAILNIDDVFLSQEALKNTKSPFILGVGINKKSDFSATGIQCLSGRPVFTVNKRFKFALKALGYYNVYNALLAIAAARVFGLGYRDIAAALSAFNPPASRLNFREIKGIRFIDDTYNSNPLSMKQALGVLEGLSGQGRKILVMGDMLELGAEAASLHNGVIREALKFVDTLIAVGPLMRSCLTKISARNKIFICETSAEAKEVLLKTAAANSRDIVLVKGSRGMKMEEVFKV